MKWENIKFSFWMNKGNLANYSRFLNRWYKYVSNLLLWPINQFDLETAELFVVDLLAWERDVERFHAEPESLYRTRVKYAYANAVDSGSVAGFKKVAERLGLGIIGINERIAGRDWDVVGLSVPDSVIAEKGKLLDVIIEQYGLTCRQYEWTTTATLKTIIKVAAVDYEMTACTARIYVDWVEPVSLLPTELGLLSNPVTKVIELGLLNDPVANVIELGAL